MVGQMYGDTVNAVGNRQELPWVRVDNDYRFDTDEGKASLADLFRGRSQLLVYHFMFGPDYKAGCISCSAPLRELIALPCQRLFRIEQIESRRKPLFTCSSIVCCHRHSPLSVPL